MRAADRRLLPIPNRGTVLASGVVIDAGLLGVQLARHPVLTTAQPDSRLHEVGPGLWLVTWPSPQRVAVRSCPGHPVIDAGDGALAFTWGGTTRLLHPGSLLHPGELAPLDTTDWFDLTGLPVRALHVLDCPPALVIPQPVATVPVAGLRARAGVRPDPATGDLLKALTEAASRAGHRVVPAAADAADARPSSLLQLLGSIGPLARWWGRRYARYLRDLERRFQHRDYDSALRRAIAVGALPGRDARLTLRMPRPRTGELRPGATARFRGPASRSLCRDVPARSLPRSGRRPDQSRPDHRGGLRPGRPAGRQPGGDQPVGAPPRV